MVAARGLTFSLMQCGRQVLHGVLLDPGPRSLPDLGRVAAQDSQEVSEILQALDVKLLQEGADCGHHFVGLLQGRLGVGDHVPKAPQDRGLHFDDLSEGVPSLDFILSVAAPVLLDGVLQSARMIAQRWRSPLLKPSIAAPVPPTSGPAWWGGSLLRHRAAPPSARVTPLRGYHAGTRSSVTPPVHTPPGRHTGGSLLAVAFCAREGPSLAGPALPGRGAGVLPIAPVFHAPSDGARTLCPRPLQGLTRRARGRVCPAQ